MGGAVLGAKTSKEHKKTETECYALNGLSLDLGHRILRPGARTSSGSLPEVAGDLTCHPRTNKLVTTIKSE